MSILASQKTWFSVSAWKWTAVVIVGARVAGNIYKPACRLPAARVHTELQLLAAITTRIQFGLACSEQNVQLDRGFTFPVYAASQQQLLDTDRLTTMNPAYC